MAISNYSELQTAVANWIDRADLTDRIKEFIALGEARIYRELRINAMVSVHTEDIGSVYPSQLSRPSDYLALLQARLKEGNYQYTLKLITLDYHSSVFPDRGALSMPKYIVEAGNKNFSFSPQPDKGYNIVLVYYARLPSLSDSNTTNWFTDNAPDILLWASLVESHAFTMDDERVGLWETKYQQAKSMIQKEDNRRYRDSSMSSTKSM